MLDRRKFLVGSGVAVAAAALPETSTSYGRGFTLQVFLPGEYEEQTSEPAVRFIFPLDPELEEIVATRWGRDLRYMKEQSAELGYDHDQMVLWVPKKIVPERLLKDAYTA